ncbi:MAG: short-chain-enoyl-CoA hydratase [Syntrophomonas sp.]
MAYQNVILEKEDRIAVLYVNRPEALNALNSDTLRDIQAAVAEVEKDESIDVLIITGAGDKAFVAGADIAYMQTLTAMEGREFGILGQKVFSDIEDLDKPVIAAVNGFALGGGCELAMCCDFRVASNKARFGQPEVGLGITPGFGGTQRLPRLVGAGMAKELLYTADVIGADEALRIGLVNHVVEPVVLLDYVKGLARRISGKGQNAVCLCKAAVNAGLQTDIDRAMTIEADVFGLCFSTTDQKEGMGAFIEKRKAVFTGR